MRALACCFFVGLWGCYSVDYPAQYQCSNASPATSRCPEGFECNGTRCVPKGSTVDAGDAVVSKPDGPTVLVVTLVAGTGSKGFANGPAGNAQFSSPVGLAVDTAGSTFVADTGNHCIRKIDNGQVTTFAGKCGEPGNADGALTLARFRLPATVIAGASGELVVSDTWNHCIRRIQGGQVTTLAGSCGPAQGGYVDGVASNAKFRIPIGITSGAGGELFVTDSGNNCLRMIKSGQVSRFAGNCSATLLSSKDGTLATARFNGPSGIWLDQSQMVVSDSSSNCIRQIVSQQVSTLAGTCDAKTAGFKDGAAAIARFSKPSGLMIGTEGIYVSDINNHALRRIAGGVVSTVAGNGVAGSQLADVMGSVFNKPSGVLVLGGGQVLVADTENHRIVKVGPGL